LGFSINTKGDNKMAKIEPFEKFPARYEEWFKINYLTYQSELQAVKDLLPENGVGMEVGIGSGRFAKPLGIKLGVEPSSEMRLIARSRGIETIDSVAESLPFKDKQFDYVLMVTTICFLNDLKAALKEVFRVLKPHGIFLVGFIEKESPLGHLCQSHKDENPFYKAAHFYSVYGVLCYLIENDFVDFQIVQTIFNDLSEINEVEPVKKGFGEGSFVVIRAEKNA
jgi:ubiquinone/menaquinone biosynthesis C-methylase UbiE